MSKTTKKAKPGTKKLATEASKKPTERRLRWSLGLFKSAKHGDHTVVAYVRKDGSPVPYQAKAVASKKALFHAIYVGVTFSGARAQLLKDAAKAGVQ